MKDAAVSEGNAPQRRLTGATHERELVSRRDMIGRFGFYGAAMALAQQAVFAGSDTPGSYGTAAATRPPASSPSGSDDDPTKAVKIARAMRAGPLQITRSATVAEMDNHGNLVNVLRKGTNQWICVPGDENRVGDPPMCVDQLGWQWFKDIHASKPAPTNTAPGLCYMLCGATQHSNETPFDRTSPAIPIGPHWMVLWPFDARHCGLPTTVRDAGAWIMFSGTPYAYLHICGTPWDGNEYSPNDEATWTMQYSKPRAPT
jgi:hypothetical protein